MIVDVLGSDEEARPRERVAKRRGGRHGLALYEPAMMAVGQVLEDASGPAVLGCGLGPGSEDSLVKVDPPIEIVGSHRVVVHPIDGAGPLVIEHQIDSPIM